MPSHKTNQVTSGNKRNKFWKYIKKTDTSGNTSDRRKKFGNKSERRTYPIIH